MTGVKINDYFKNKQVWVLLLVHLIIPLFLLYFNLLSLPFVAWGMLAWIIALLIKVFVFGSLHYQLKHYIKNILFLSLSWGLLSATSELGISVLFFEKFEPELTLTRVISFGMGAGIIECLYLLLADAFTKKNTERDYSPFVMWSGVIERIYTSLGHVFSRSIIWIAWIYGNYIIMSLSIMLFALADGTATYGDYKKWDYFDDRYAKPFHLFMCILTLVEGILFLFLLRISAI